MSWEPGTEDSVFDRGISVVSWTPELIDKLLSWSMTRGASDIVLQPNDQIWMRRHGSWYRVTDRMMSPSELDYILNQIARQSNASALARSGEDLDFAYEVQIERGRRYRFRCNATGCRTGWGTGVEITLRTIPELPPPIESMNLPPEIIEAFCPKYGLVLVTGPVGSGKSTLLMSVLRHISETSPRRILTYESPIEFDLVSVPNRMGPVTQTEVPSHLREFENAARNSLRRAGDVVLFGESRDRETLKAMSIEAETGVAVYSTVHTNSVAETLSRIVREFPVEERDGMSATLLAATRLIVHQRLLPRADGKGRIAVREWLVFDEKTRDELVRTRQWSELLVKIQEMVIERGQPLMTDIERRFEEGMIFEEDYRLFKKLLSKDQESLLKEVEST